MSKDKKSKLDVSMFGESTGLADVKLVVEGTAIPVVKAVLSISSPVFRAMFQRDFREKDQLEVPLPGKNLDDVLTLLKCIYPDSWLTITESVAFTVLPLSDEYQMMSLKTKCEDTLLQVLDQKFDDFYMKDFPYLFKFLSVSVEFRLQRLEKYCVSLAADFTQRERKESMLEQSIPADVVKQIDDLAILRLEVRNNDLVAMSEICDMYGSNYAIKDLFESPNDISDRMRGMRLAYSFRGFRRTKNLAAATIREDKTSENWWHDEEYNLLPENIKRDIECEPAKNVE